MKTKLFFLIFICLPIMAFGQGTISVTKSNVAKCNGSANNGLWANGATYARQLSQWTLGYYYANYGNGRGYIEFNLHLNF